MRDSDRPRDLTTPPVIPETLSHASLRACVAERGTIQMPWTIPVATMPVASNGVIERDHIAYDSQLRALLLSLEAAVLLDNLADRQLHYPIDLRKKVIGSPQRLTWQTAYRVLVIGTHCTDPIFGWTQDSDGIHKVRLLVSLPDLITRVCGPGSSAAFTEQSAS